MTEGRERSLGDNILSCDKKGEEKRGGLSMENLPSIQFLRTTQCIISIQFSKKGFFTSPLRITRSISPNVAISSLFS